jgi:hypothetical protein
MVILEQDLMGEYRSSAVQDSWWKAEVLRQQA